MNIFRFIADLLHLASFFILIFKIRKSMNVVGNHFKSIQLVQCYIRVLLALSLKAITIFLNDNNQYRIFNEAFTNHFLNHINRSLLQVKRNVFLLRYWDLFLYFVSWYNSIMKILYISLTAYLIYIIRLKRPYCLTYDSQNDSFPHLKFLYPGAALLTLFFHTKFSPFELSWSYSIWLEALAILPQLHMIQQTKECENITGHYMATLGFYRFFYILNWILRYLEDGHFQWVSTLGGILQTALYSDFLYVYLKNRGRKIEIPV